MDNKKKVFKIIELSILAFFVLVFAGCIIFEIAMPEEPFSKWLQDNVWDIRGTLVSIKSHIPVFIKSVRNFSRAFGKVSIPLANENKNCLLNQEKTSSISSTLKYLKMLDHLS